MSCVCLRALCAMYCVMLYGLLLLTFPCLCGCVVHMFVWCVYDVLCAVVGFCSVLLCVCACGV